MGGVWDPPWTPPWGVPVGGSWGTPPGMVQKDPPWTPPGGVLGGWGGLGGPPGGRAKNGQKSAF